MNIYFGCLTRKITNSRVHYEAIRDILVESDHVLTKDWLMEDATPSKDKNNFQEWNKNVLESIIKSDIAIFDISDSSTSIGYQITFALGKGKPTLLLSSVDVSGLSEGFLGGIENKNLEMYHYPNYLNAKDIIEKFLIKHQRKDKERFNLILERKYLDFLDTYSYQHQKTKTEVVRIALESLMSKK